jgi:hypothetical protein
MSVPQSAAETKRPLPGGPLPDVTPPTATFILQLFLIPLLIVSIVVVLWVLFSWVAHMGRDNAADLAKAIARNDAASWQRAYELADLLRSPDPKYAALRADRDLAMTLANFLDRDLAEPLAAGDSILPSSSLPGSGSTNTYSGSQAPLGSERRARIMRRMYLCRSLGSFTVLDGLPVLLKAARQENDPVEVQVRFSAIEALATLADNKKPSTLAEQPEVLETLVAASREADDAPLPAAAGSGAEDSLYRPHAELRAVAAYALGVIGGPQAYERLESMLHDTYPNARYNAATGLARTGNAKCVLVLREMLDPANPLAVKDEVNPNDQARKRTTVLLNGIKATLHLKGAAAEVDLSPLVAALKQLRDAPLDAVTIDPSKVKSAAAEALRVIEGG